MLECLVCQFLLDVILTGGILYDHRLALISDCTGSRSASSASSANLLQLKNPQKKKFFPSTQTQFFIRRTAIKETKSFILSPKIVIIRRPLGDLSVCLEL